MHFVIPNLHASFTSESNPSKPIRCTLIMLRLLGSQFRNRPRNNIDAISFWSSPKYWHQIFKNLAVSFIYNPIRSKRIYCWHYWSNSGWKTKSLMHPLYQSQTFMPIRSQQSFPLKNNLLKLRYDAIIIFIIAHFLTQNACSSLSRH